MVNSYMKTTISRLQAHPWHGVPCGVDAPKIVNAFIEILPTDTVKYEVDKASGLLKVDRPQRFSNFCPMLYGFVPQTYCGPGVAELRRSGKRGKKLVGDGDPLDICVLSERTISQGGILLRAIPIGGLCLFDKGEVDDKIIAVMVDDAAYGGWSDLSKCPQCLIDRLCHYFLSYKTPPGATSKTVRISDVYGRAEAFTVIKAAQQDYENEFGEVE